jgi:hypothetical protein
MRTLFLIFFLSAISTYSNCQSLATPYDSNKNHAVDSYYFELAGNGFMYSVNYDRLLVEKEKYKISGRIGFTYLPYWEAISEVRGPGLPLEVNFLLGKRSDFLELGLGATYFYFTQPSDHINYNFLMENLRIGFRHQRKDGGFLFRIALVPISTFPIDPRFDDDGWIIPYFVGISIGFSPRQK